MAMGQGNKNYQQFFMLGLVLLIVMMMIIPVPAVVLDLLLSMNIAFSILLLMYALSVKESLEMSVFPSLLLIATLFRLALNISSTRLILLDAYAGEVVQAFGHFVVRGNYVVGFIVFVILIVINFVVITKGSERVSEVAARFTLDAMPGKQMSIDADLNAHIINEEEARRRRRKIQQEADFYGAMDGASKFVKGDAIAGIVITLINIIGGFIIGMVQAGMDFQTAATTYTLLTIGDGLVTQIPALLVSTATGILVTKAASESNISEEVSVQLLAHPQVMMIAGCLIGLIGLIPGLPTIPFLVIGVGLVLVSKQVEKNHAIKAKEEQQKVGMEKAQQNRKPENIMSMIGVDKLQIEIGFKLIALADRSRPGNIVDRINMVRRQIASELGLVMPPVRIRDNTQLPPGRYVIRLKDVEVASYDLEPEMYLVIGDQALLDRIDGKRTIEPAFKLPAKWVADRTQAEALGLAVIDAPTVLTTHLTQVIKTYAHEILGREDTKKMVEKMKEQASSVIEDLVPDKLDYGTIQKVLCRLLKEQVSIRDMLTILEVLADVAGTTKDPIVLTEHVRMGLKRQISKACVNDEGLIPVITLDPQTQSYLIENMSQGDFGMEIHVEPEYLQELFEKMVGVVAECRRQGIDPVFLVHPQLRPYIRDISERYGHPFTVLSYNEVDTIFNYKTVGNVHVPINQGSEG